MNKDKSNRARLDFASHLKILAAPSGGCTKASPQFKTLQDLAKIYICTMHQEHASKAEEQWLDELNAEGTSRSFQFEECHRFESRDTRTEESEKDRDGIEETVHGSDMAEREPDKEEIAFEEEEGVSVLSSQSTVSVGTIRRSFTMQEDEVAKDVTWLLKQPLEGKDWKSGWIYVICPPNLPGKIKVGYTLEHPTLGRFHDHSDCYGEFEKIAMEYTPFAYRVEQLLLAEFSNKHYKLEVDCQKCKRCHEELLDIDKETLLSSLKKWIAFVKFPCYSRSGLFRTEAESRLPLPASSDYLVCKRPRRRVIRGPTQTKKEGSQDSQITPLPTLDFESPTSAAKYPRVDEVEVDSEVLCSGIEGLQLTPSKSRRRVSKGMTNA